MNSKILSSQPITVAKFGGTSLADFQAMLRCAHIVKKDTSNRLIVVSASAGITNYLVRLSQENVSNKEQGLIIADIGAIQFNITKHFIAKVENKLNQGVHHLLNLLSHYAQSQSNKYSAKTVDAILALGEQFSSKIFTQVLQSIDVACEYFDVQKVMRTNSFYGKAVVDEQHLKLACKQLLLPKLSNTVFVTQGFIGQDKFSNTTTLGRGGSDYSAALLAEALNSNNLAIWTDVVGIFTTDPHITSQAKAIKEISFGEAAEMATLGAKILHPATLIPAMRQNISVFVGSSKEPEKGGTHIKHKVNSTPTYRSISLRKEQTLVTVKSLIMLNSSAFLAKIFTTIAQHELSVDLVTTNELSVALTFDNPKSTTQSLLISTVVEELEKFFEVTVEHGLSLIAVIGNGLNSTKDIGQSIFGKINETNIRLIFHGASANNLCLLVNENDAHKVIEKLHDSLFSCMV
ncbi:MAG: lysine-sensitive aspartokinase 3 [Gammaproteobacteria bacterium]|nr:lysine-sensitive aspartokinase 3 [Gammaproteobacteria bacterium]